MALAQVEISTDPRVEDVFSNYPERVSERMTALRKLVLQAAEEIEGLHSLEETLKWGEPSYLSKQGSTVRMDWKAKSPEQYAVFFKCTSKLVPTFREIYPTTFTFEGNRAIVFSLDEEVPEKELKHCLKVALTYHRVKHLPLLGM